MIKKLLSKHIESRFGLVLLVCICVSLLFGASFALYRFVSTRENASAGIVCPSGYIWNGSQCEERTSKIAESSSISCDQSLSPVGSSSQDGIYCRYGFEYIATQTFNSCPSGYYSVDGGASYRHCFGNSTPGVYDNGVNNTVCASGFYSVRGTIVSPFPYTIQDYKYICVPNIFPGIYSSSGSVCSDLNRDQAVSLVMPQNNYLCVPKRNYYFVTDVACSLGGIVIGTNCIDRNLNKKISAGYGVLLQYGLTSQTCPSGTSLVTRIQPALTSAGGGESVYPTPNDYIFCVFPNIIESNMITNAGSGSCSTSLFNQYYSGSMSVKTYAPKQVMPAGMPYPTIPPVIHTLCVSKYFDLSRSVIISPNSVDPLIGYIRSFYLLGSGGGVQQTRLPYVFQPNQTVFYPRPVAFWSPSYSDGTGEDLVNNLFDVMVADSLVTGIDSIEYYPTSGASCPSTSYSVAINGRVNTGTLCVSNDAPGFVSATYNSGSSSYSCPSTTTLLNKIISTGNDAPICVPNAISSLSLSGTTSGSECPPDWTNSGYICYPRSVSRPIDQVCPIGFVDTGDTTPTPCARYQPASYYEIDPPSIGTGSCTPPTITIYGETTECTFGLTGAPSGVPYQLPSTPITASISTATGVSSFCYVDGSTLVCEDVPGLNGTIGLQSATTTLGGSAPVTLTGNPDLIITKNQPTTFVAGLPIEYTLTVTNNGQGTAQLPITVTDTLPPTLTYITYTTLDGFVCSNSGQVVTCQASSPLAPNDSISVVLIVGFNP